MKSWTLTLILSAFILQACQRDVGTPSTHEEATQQALDLMHKGQNDQAINILKNEQSQRPTERTQILLASAYANRAGIKVNNYWSFLITRDNLLQNSDIFTNDTEEADVKDLLARLPVEARNSAKNITRNLSELQRIRKRLDQIPIVSEKQQTDLLAAIDTLQNTSTQGARMYRAILEIILLRTAAENGYQFFTDSIKSPKLECQDNISQSLDWIQYTTEIFQDLLVDIVIAFPTQKASLKPLQAESSELLTNLQEQSSVVQGLMCKK